MWRGSAFNRYIPNLDWNQIEEDMGLSSLLKHLLVPKGDEIADVKQDSSQILSMILSVLEVSPEDFSPEVPFTAYGMDSLGATRIAESVRPYANVSQMQLLGGMCWTQLQKRLSVAEGGSSSQTSPTAALADMVAKYSQAFITHVPSAPAPPTGQDVVLITGTTGAVGTTVLAQLLGCETVSRVYALNRKALTGRSLYERQREALEDKGMDPAVCDSPKLVLLEGNLNEQNLGLDSTTLLEVCASWKASSCCAELAF